MITVLSQDIFDIKCDAIVNPANATLLRGGGLCGAIHKNAGPELEAACKLIGAQEISSVVLTPSFNLGNCKYIFHACGPRWTGGANGEANLLEATYLNLFNACLNHKINSVAVPAISTGIYSYPFEEAADIAIKVAKGFSKQLEIIFVNPDLKRHQFYKERIENLIS